MHCKIRIPFPFAARYAVAALLPAPIALSQGSADAPIELAPYTVLADPLDARELVPTRLIDSPFGTSQTVREIPRSVTLVSSEQLAVFGVRNYDDLQGLAPSLFSSTIFGISGTPDIRGAIAETYYRGMKRADNRGIFPQPIGAAQRLEVVKGPPSPLFGAGALGGYVNFVPKTARAEVGTYLEALEGMATVQVGSYRQRIGELELGGPLPEVGGVRSGFYLFGSYEDSDSFYHDSFDRLGLLQGTLAMTFSPSFRLETGGQLQSWDGTEISGYNRIDQRLIDEGLYQTGQAFSTDVYGQPLDQDGNGRLSANEVIRALSLPPAGADPLENPIIRWNSIDPATDQGLVAIDRRQTIIDPGDSAHADSALAFLDLIYTPNERFELKNQLFYDGYSSGKDTTQGFNGLAEIGVLENKLTARQVFELREDLRLTQHLLGSVRRQTVDRAWGLDLQNFNRRDVMQGPSVADRFHRYSENGEAAYPYNQRWDQRYTAYSAGGLSSLNWHERYELTVGGRYDAYDIDHRYISRPDLFVGTEYFSTLQLFYGPDGLLDYDPATETPADYLSRRRQTGWDQALSWHASISAELTPQITAYATVARQSDVRRGDAGEYPGIIPDPAEGEPLPLKDNFLAESELREGGLKGLWLDDRLFVAVSVYELERTSSNPRATTTNDYRNTGAEIEVRWAASERVSLFANLNFQNSEYLVDYREQLDEGFFFVSHPAFAGIPLTAPGGLLDSSYDTGLAFEDSAYAGNEPNERKAIPHQVLSLGGTYTADRFGFAGLLTYYGESGLARPWFVTLPDYWLAHVSAFYRWDDWFVNLRVKNALDEAYWQNTDPDYLGGGSVIPMPGRTWELALSRRF